MIVTNRQTHTTVRCEKTAELTDMPFGMWTQLLDGGPNQLGHMQVCTSLQIDNHASTPPLSFFTDALPAAQPIASKH